MVVGASAGNHTGIGYTHAHESAATLVREKLADIVVGRDALQIAAAWSAMVDGCRRRVPRSAPIEHELFDGLPAPAGGCLVPDRDRPGLGLELKRADAATYQVWP